MRKKSEFDTYQSELRFDNLNFKLAVLQNLIFEKKVFSPQYEFEGIQDRYYEEEYSPEEYEEAMERYIREALQYFTYLKVPAEMAKYVTELQITAGDDIYFEIAPEWDGEERLFNVDYISDREIAQFPQLKKISFWYMSDQVEALRKQLKKHRIKVELGQKDASKRISGMAALFCILTAAVGMGAVTGGIFANRYRDVEVSWSEEPITTNEAEKPGEADSDTDSNTGSDVQYDYDESQAELKDKLEELLGEQEQTTEENTNE